MKIQIPPWERSAFLRHLANFPKGIAFEHNDRVLGRGMAQAELQKMVPETAGGAGI